MLKGKTPLSITKEYKIDYNVPPCRIKALDDFWLSKNESRNKYLMVYYFGVIDDVVENERKLYITSNISLKEWLDKIRIIDEEMAMRISSRFSNTTSLIHLDGVDRRKEK
jgi:DNA replication protein DnaC